MKDVDFERNLRKEATIVLSTMNLGERGIVLYKHYHVAPLESLWRVEELNEFAYRVEKSAGVKPVEFTPFSEEDQCLVLGQQGYAFEILKEGDFNLALDMLGLDGRLGIKTKRPFEARVHLYPSEEFAREAVIPENGNLSPKCIDYVLRGRIPFADFKVEGNYPWAGRMLKPHR